MKLWQTHSKLVFGLWDMALVSQTMLYMLGTSIFLLFIPFSSRKEHRDVQECQSRACVPGAEGRSLSCQHVGISAWKPVLLGMGTIPTEAGADGTRSLNQPVSFMLY